MIRYSTFSIVALDPATGELGSAVASCALAAGSAVPHINRHGIVHTQHHAAPAIAENILLSLARGVPPSEAIQHALAGDKSREQRQILCLNAGGAGAAYTGRECRARHRHIVGAHFAAAGNTLTDEKVIDALAEAFQTNDRIPLSARLLAALLAGEAAGGDSRGKQSASLKTMNPNDPEHWYLYPDLRVDDHPNPLAELSRLHDIFVRKKQDWR
jgi:uncharacterized Ntn-hydrolase superfamily protein